MEGINIDQHLTHILEQRKQQSLNRYLQVQDQLIDFCSNDYLSFAKSSRIQKKVNEAAAGMHIKNGSTGSRSISGNTAYAEELEQFIANFHHAEAALLFNSGYDANLGVFSCIANKDDTIICDQLVHASIIDGCRLSYATRLRFAHNDISDLEKKLQNSKGNIFVAVESVYSMDGDTAPLKEISAICKKYKANLIVDEAHATGILGDQGRGLVNHYNLESEVFARVHTFGKAMGCHGAAVVGSKALREYLINFSRSFIFTTALPMHSLLTIRFAYENLLQHTGIDHLRLLVNHFKKDFSAGAGNYLIDSHTPIQSLVIPGNERARSVSKQLQSAGFDIRAILSPSVPAGRERLRISLHAHNTFEQVDQLKLILNQILENKK